ncbi:MAG: hypothetical protein II975_06425 [Bacteroidales bacterium]|nr:hypothetical protein [Bacteroidales bacterium]
MTALNTFCQDAITKFEEHQIDALFCYIQSDKKLMKDYLDLVAADGNDLGKVNRSIARAFAVKHGTRSSIERNYEPNSVLIQSYSILED